MSFYIADLNRNIIDLKEMGIEPLKLEPDSLSAKNEDVEIEGMDGFLEVETSNEGRTLRASFLMKSKDKFDHSALRSKVFSLFNGKNRFYIADSKEPHKLWKVRTAGKFTPEKLNHFISTFLLELESASPYAESASTTLNPTWGFQVSTDEPIQFIYQQPAFSIWNDGDEPVDPRDRWAYLQVIFQGASDNLTIKNLTTGDEWSYTGTTTAGDIIELNGIRSLKNGSSIFGQTNRKLLTLAPGMNQFEISGATGPFQISFDFRFYYI